MDPAIRMTGVTKTFGQMTAVADLDLEVPRGGLYGFIGPNGAGKTTTIRMIMSILFPDAGAVSILGHPSALEAKDRIGYLPEERGLYKRMKVQPFLRYLARLKNADGPDLDRRITGALERVGLGGVESKRCDELSKGMSQKVQFVAATIHGPDLLILDEPFSGLDPVSMRMLRDLILKEHDRGATVLFSTHVMPQAEEICQHVIMVHEGRKVLDADIGDIRSRYDPCSIRFEPLDPGADTTALTSIPGVERVRTDDRGPEIVLRAGTDPAAAMRRILDAMPAARIELSRPRLEDVFVELVAGGAAATDADRLRASLLTTPTWLPASTTGTSRSSTATFGMRSSMRASRPAPSTGPRSTLCSGYRARRRPPSAPTASARRFADSTSSCR